MPARIEPPDDVAVAVAEHGRQGRVLDALGIEERAVGARLGQGPALEPELLQRWSDFTFNVPRKLRGSFGILALRWDRDPAGEVGLEPARVEIGLRADNGGGTGHELARWEFRRLFINPAPISQTAIDAKARAWEGARGQGATRLYLRVRPEKNKPPEEIGGLLAFRRGDGVRW